MGHTPKPWYDMIYDGESCPTIIGSAGDECIAIIDGNQDNEANAEFIVRACNTHYDLLEACKIAKEWFDDFTLDKEPYKERPAADLATIMFDVIIKANF